MVIGAQRTGTNILREILNTNEHIAMLGEVLMPNPARPTGTTSAAPCQFSSINPVNFSEAESLLDRYFDFVRVSNSQSLGRQQEEP